MPAKARDRSQETHRVGPRRNRLPWKYQPDPTGLLHPPILPLGSHIATTSRTATPEIHHTDLGPPVDWRRSGIRTLRDWGPDHDVVFRVGRHERTYMLTRVGRGTRRRRHARLLQMGHRSFPPVPGRHMPKAVLPTGVKETPNSLVNYGKNVILVITQRPVLALLALTSCVSLSDTAAPRSASADHAARRDKRRSVC